MARIEIRHLDCIDTANFITAKKRIVEYGTVDSSSEKIDSILIELCFEGDTTYIDLDKSTAIKFSKTLRTEINKIGGQDE